MREPMPDTTWERFLAEKIRQRNEIQIAMKSATWWEAEQMKDQLKEIWFSIAVALQYVDIQIDDGEDAFSECFEVQS